MCPTRVMRICLVLSIYLQILACSTVGGNSVDTRTILNSFLISSLSVGTVTYLFTNDAKQAIAVGMVGGIAGVYIVLEYGTNVTPVEKEKPEFKRGKELFDSGKSELEYAIKLIEYSKGQPTGTLTLKKSLEKANNLIDEVRSYLYRSGTQNPRPEPFQLLSVIAIFLKDYVEAEQYLVKALELAPDYKPARQTLTEMCNAEKIRDRTICE